jgi:protein-S-isoprenylcysteine O-methyltransferase Ste14
VSDAEAHGAGIERPHGPVGRLGLALVRRRGFLLGPLFVAGAALVRPSEHELLLEGASAALALGAWSVRLWAMGYRNWVRGPGERHLMTRGPYAWVRHPRYVANFVAGLAWFLLVLDPWLALGYAALYWLVLGVVIVREEEKLAHDYPGFAEWRARVPAIVPRPWRRWIPPGPAPGERWERSTVSAGELAKLGLFLGALAALAWARRSGLAFEIRARLLG